MFEEALLSVGKIESGIMGNHIPEERKRDSILADKELDWGTETMVVYDEGVKTPPNKVFIKKEWMLFQLLASICLVLVMAIIYRTSAPWTNEARSVISGVYEQEFQFASVVNWFDETIGQPFAFLPREFWKRYGGAISLCRQAEPSWKALNIMVKALS